MAHRTPRRLIVLGTGTEIGKTFVAAALARALQKRASSVVAVKPIETGCGNSGEPTEGSDAWQLERASQVGVVRPHPLYAFADPVSPHLAARRARSSIDLAEVRRWVEGIESAMMSATIQYDTSWLIVETAGGAFSPVSDSATNADLARELDPAVWLLVAPDSLGVLHDLRATLGALRAVAREPDLIALSAARAADASTGTNAAELARLGIAKPAAVFERDSEACAAQLAEALMQL